MFSSRTDKILSGAQDPPHSLLTVLEQAHSSQTVAQRPSCPVTPHPNNALRFAQCNTYTVLLTQGLHWGTKPSPALSPAQ